MKIITPARSYRRRAGISTRSYPKCRAFPNFLPTKPVLNSLCMCVGKPSCAITSLAASQCDHIVGLRKSKKNWWSRFRRPSTSLYSISLSSLASPLNRLWLRLRLRLRFILSSLLESGCWAALPRIGGRAAAGSGGAAGRCCHCTHAQFSTIATPRRCHTSPAGGSREGLSPMWCHIL